MALATQDAVVLELMTMGQESAAYLGELLRSSSPSSSPHQELAAEILRCCGRVIAALKASAGKRRKAVHQHEDAAVASPPPSPPRKSSRSAEAHRVVTSATTVDGFIWRKYGQKEINGRKHPRLYYRCAYRHQGCAATRRVQRTHEDGEPPAYEIAYYGEHTCRGAVGGGCQGGAAPPPPSVIDFGSNAWASVVGAAASQAPEQHQLWSCDGEMSLSQGGWSSSASSEAGFEAQTTHEWRDTTRLEDPSVAPCYSPDPVTEFLDGSFYDWASVLNDDPFGFDALHHIAALQ